MKNIEQPKVKAPYRDKTDEESDWVYPDKKWDFGLLCQD